MIQTGLCDISVEDSEVAVFDSTDDIVRISNEAKSCGLKFSFLVRLHREHIHSIHAYICLL